METDTAAQLAAAAAAAEEALSVLPSPAALGVDGVRSVVIFYANDGIPKAEALLETFEDESEEYAACECALVAVRCTTTARAHEPDMFLPCAWHVPRHLCIVLCIAPTSHRRAVRLSAS